jgi:hypothetical protein
MLYQLGWRAPTGVRQPWRPALADGRDTGAIATFCDRRNTRAARVQPRQGDVTDLHHD